MRYFYKIGFWFFALLYLPFFFLKRKHKDNWPERFGQVPDETAQKLAGKKVIWVHAVSVGEVSLAIRLIGAMKERGTGHSYVLTVTTAAGREAAMKLKDDEDTVLYFPADFGFSVRAFIRSVRPKALVILETEIWPNLIDELSRRTIPVYIVNARISDKAIAKYRWARGFMRRVLARVTVIGAQDELMRERFISVGANPQQVQITGNMKFDWRPAAGRESVVEKIRQYYGAKPFLCIGGSTHAGEEAALLKIAASISKERPYFKLMLAPRHMDRLDKVLKEVEDAGFTPVRASLLIDGGSAPVWNGKQVLILDKIGILSALYEIADAVFVGGSLVNVGGHNLVEPAFFEKPVFHGPFMSNFLEMVQQFQEAGAGVQVASAAELESGLRKVMESPAEAREMGRRARALVLKHQGATQKNIELLRGVLT
jgi:3-deoxy-D-manno-octulosonic-acid transferase